MDLTSGEKIVLEYRMGVVSVHMSDSCTELLFQNLC